MSDDDLVKRADEALKDVTPGPWLYAFHDHKDGDQVEVISQTPEGRVRQVHEHDLGYNDDVDIQIVANARFIAAARELVPAMRARIEADAKLIGSLETSICVAAGKLRDAEARIAELKSDLIGALARIAELEAEKRYWSGEIDTVLAGRADECARAEAAEARIAELEAALRAVALSAGCCDACPCHMTATRKARAALEGEK